MRKKFNFIALLMVIFIVLSPTGVHAENITTNESVDISTNVLEGTDDEYQVDVRFSGDGGTITTSTTSNKLDVVIVLDTSGSMYGTPLASAKENAKSFVTSLLSNSNNRVSIIGFSSSATVYCDLNNDLNATLASIDSITAYGGTSTNLGIDAANAQLNANARSDTQKVVVLLSDGSFTYSSASTAMDNLVADHYPVTIKTIGYNISSGSSASIYLQDLASKDVDNGEYYDASTDDLGTVFDIIYTSLQRSIDEVNITAAIPENFNIVEGSLVNPDGLVFDMDKFANGEIDASLSNVVSNKTYTFSYRIKINQDKASEDDNYMNNGISHQFDYIQTDDNSQLVTTTVYININALIYKIETKSDSNGSISDSRFVGHGANHEVTWLSNYGYQLDKLVVDGIEQTDINDSYVLSNIIGDHKVEVTFKTSSSTINDDEDPVVEETVADETVVTKNTPATGDYTNVSVFALMGLTALAIMYIVINKKIKN